MTDCRNGAIDLSEFERQLDELHHRKRHQGSASRRLADKHSPPKSSSPTRVAASEAASVHARPMPVTQWPHLTQKRARACVGARTDAQVTQGSAAAGDMLSVTGGIFGSRRAPHGCMLHRRIVAFVAFVALIACAVSSRCRCGGPRSAVLSTFSAHRCARCNISPVTSNSCTIDRL